MIDPQSMKSMAQNMAQKPVQAAQGSMSKYLPWYSSAAGGMTGAHLAGKVVPKKYKFLGQLAGTLLGTGAGLHTGEAVGKALDKRKAAMNVKQAEAEEKAPHPGVTLAKSLGGFGLGMAGGYAGMKGLDALMRAGGGKGLPKHVALKALPVVTGLGGLAYQQMQNRTLDKMREDHLNRQEKKRGGKGS